VLLDQIAAFRGLRSLLLQYDVEDLTTQFLADLAKQHGTTLRHLRIVNCTQVFDDGSTDQSNVEEFFSRCTRLQTLYLGSITTTLNCPRPFRHAGAQEAHSVL